MPAFKRTIHRPRLHNYIVDASESNVGNRPLAGEDRVVAGTIRPNGSGSFGFRRRKGELARERTNAKSRKVKVNAIAYLDYDQYEGENNTTRVVRCDKRVNTQPPLTLSEPLIGRKDGKRVSKGLTRHGIRIIESALTLMERKYGVRGLGFYTLTCPFDTDEEVDEFNAAFPTIVKRTLESIKRHYEKKGKRFTYVGVHEIQTARAARSGRHCLHFHFVGPCKMGRRKGYVCSADKIRSWYQAAIRNALPHRDCPRPRVGVEVCRKSSIAYIAKYYSKGVSKDAGTVGTTRPVELSSWYVVSRGALRASRKAQYNVDNTIADAVYRHYEGAGDNSCITFSRTVKVLRDGCERLVGYVFKVSKEWLDPWLDHCMYEITDMI